MVTIAETGDGYGFADDLAVFDDGNGYGDGFGWGYGNYQGGGGFRR